MPACYLPETLRHAQNQREHAHSGLKRAHSLYESRQVITVEGTGAVTVGKLHGEGGLGQAPDPGVQGRQRWQPDL